MGLIQLLFHNPLLFAVVAVSLLYSIIAHEVAHGFTAYLFGDDTARRYGRLTLNPVPHIDPIGALMLLFVGFGWAKPVPVNYGGLGNSRIAVIAVSLAGCFTNIVIATISLFLLQFPAVSGNDLLSTLFSILAHINIILGAFNLIPIPPLDGSRVLMVFLPWSAQRSLARIEPYGFFIIVILLFTKMLNPVITFVQNAIFSLIGLVFSLLHIVPGG